MSYAHWNNIDCMQGKMQRHTTAAGCHGMADVGRTATIKISSNTIMRGLAEQPRRKDIRRAERDANAIHRLEKRIPLRSPTRKNNNNNKVVSSAAMAAADINS
jgi:hypothetical protein